MAKGGARPGSGRRRKSTELKKLDGTERKDRDGGGDAPAVPGQLISPMHLGDHEQLYFGSIAKMLEEQGRASPHFSEHVALTAVRLAQVERFAAVLSIEGDTYQSKTAHGFMIRKRPEVQMLSDAMRHAQSLLGELMLNPSAAMRLAEGDKPDEGGFAELFRQ
jgi:phage terminase small subunit